LIFPDVAEAMMNYFKEYTYSLLEAKIKFLLKKEYKKEEYQR